jgi:hypothetical protein
MEAKRRDRHVPRHTRYVPREPWRLFSDLRSRPALPDAATITRGIRRSEVGWVRAELARNHKNAVGR